MLQELLIKGWLTGFLIALPVGPIGIICIQNSLTRGFACGLASGFGAAAADAFFALLAAFSFTFICDFLHQYEIACKIVGAFILIGLGLRTIVSSDKMAVKNLPNDKSLVRIFISTFFVTLANPFTMLAFMGIFAALGVVFLEGHPLLNSLTLLSVFIGSTTWWLLLTFASQLVKHRITLQRAYLFNRISGILIIGFGIIAGATAFFPFDQIIAFSKT